MIREPHSAAAAFSAIGCGLRVTRDRHDVLALGQQPRERQLGDLDALVRRQLAELVDRGSPRRPATGYAAELFDCLPTQPEAVRMINWRRLQRPQVGPRLAATLTESMAAVRDTPAAVAAGRSIGPADLIILIIGLANAWQLSAPDILAAAKQDPTDPARIAVHRAAVIEAARRISDTTSQ